LFGNHKTGNRARCLGKGKEIAVEKKGRGDEKKGAELVSEKHIALGQQKTAKMGKQVLPERK